MKKLSLHGTPGQDGGVGIHTSPSCTTRDPAQREERATLGSPGKELKETTSLSPTESQSQKFTPMKTAGKVEHMESQKQTKRVT